MSLDEKGDKALDLIRYLENSYSQQLVRPLIEAIYLFDEACIWKNDNEVKDARNAIRIWALVEYIRINGEWPEELVP